MFSRIWVRHLYGTDRLIMERFGDEVRIIMRGGQKNQWSNSEIQKNDSPEGFAMTQAVVCKNIFGSEFEVLEDKDVTLVIKGRARWKAVLELAKEGKPITRTQCCGLCIMDIIKSCREVEVEPGCGLHRQRMQNDH